MPAPSDEQVSVVELIHDAMPRMSTTDRRIAHILLADLPRGALGTASELAARAEVSAASVVRFCRRIGFAGFTDLGERVRTEVSRTANSPVARARTLRPDTALDRELEHRAELVRTVMSSVPANEIDRVLTLLSDTARTVMTAGGTLSQLAARYLQLQLRHVRPRVLHLADPDQSDVGTVLDLRRRDIVVLFDFRRYEPRSMRLAERARERGASVILVTDAWLSPVARIADIVLPLDVEASFLDSLTPAFALVESLVPALAARLGEKSLHQMDRIESLRQRAD
ncbi:MurR/RpiR family transcriptional regulator [Microbacterium sp. NPDC079995]|uniref:MurR/RpiR family transcriptional regulator n=1 Tax=unclassified Microbacterium TaxID=2609290 RepID=UPI003450CC31